ncbi:MAG: hypothetical protein JWM89_2621 [Acidimicrobiales bacterium]|nr:hypothetical protein [Acidimicrobiales bacterium]
MSILHDPRVTVRPVSPADYDALRANELTWTFGGGFRFGGRTPSPDAHVAALWNGVLLQSVGVAPPGEELLGLYTCFDADLRHGHASIAVAAQDRHIGSGAAFVGLGLFITDLFTEWPFRKLYAQSRAGAYERFALGAGRLFTVEGRLSGHHHLNGTTEDTFLLTIDRTAWMAGMGARLRRRAHLLRAGAEGTARKAPHAQLG